MSVSSVSLSDMLNTMIAQALAFMHLLPLQSEGIHTLMQVTAQEFTGAVGRHGSTSHSIVCSTSKRSISTRSSSSGM